MECGQDLPDFSLMYCRSATSVCPVRSSDFLFANLFFYPYNGPETQI